MNRLLVIARISGNVTDADLGREVWSYGPGKVTFKKREENSLGRVDRLIDSCLHITRLELSKRQRRKTITDINQAELT